MKKLYFILTLCTITPKIMSSDSTNFASHGCIDPYKIMEHAQDDLNAEGFTSGFFCKKIRPVCSEPLQQFYKLIPQKQNDPEVIDSTHAFNSAISPLQNYQIYHTQADANAKMFENILACNSDQLLTIYAKIKNNLDLLYKIHIQNLITLNRRMPNRFLKIHKDSNPNPSLNPSNTPYLDLKYLLFSHAPVNYSLPIIRTTVGYFDVQEKTPISCALFPLDVKAATEKYLRNKYDCALLVLEMAKTSANAQQTKQ